MAFVDITNRIEAILTENKAALTSGCDDHNIEIENRFPEEHFANQVIFVWRDSLPEIEYGSITGEGLSASGEIDGLGQWRVAVYIRFPGNEKTAAEQLSILAWNLLGLLAGFRRETTDPQWAALLVQNSRATTLAGTNGWYVGEQFTLGIRWSMEF